MSAVWHDAADTFHEIYTGSIIIAGKYFGAISYDSGRDDLRWHRCSYAYFCPDCGDVWARLVMSDSRGIQRPFEVKAVACEQHHDWWNIPGSLLVGYLEYLIDSLPPDAVRREFYIHLAYAEKELEL